ncbi:protein-L-isoaspartate O-methyltransferase family protein [Candidatus Contendibacter odensensis]|uniref:Protein-L-isoaspartate O-methyltransferase n=1 Tax=Candidatus Contendobacter odensis Run_B_J11 TaxID=1400861 RepID=A0A7U7J5L5_9GAMM|nr:protein-L-isoaspartate O-methyltransferase [Candidatus Contendobacter odensis]CDH46547.1 Protein-L-isoaspartate(D-aspartate) O-methyltransferase [Candidatus Contendobacter odensis Run_B_J11]
MTAFNFELARYNLIEQQIRPWDVLDQRVLDVLADIPREDFVPDHYRNLAFSDIAIPLGHGEFMLRPTVEGRILQALALQPTDRVLEIGTGSAYLTAALARLAASVTSIDILPEFTEAARHKLKMHGFDNAMLHSGDASQGWGEQRYHAIAVTGSVATMAEVWRQSLRVGGRLFIVIGQPPVMEALLITRVGEQEWIRESLFDTELSPLRNAEPIKHFEF